MVRYTSEDATDERAQVSNGRVHRQQTCVIGKQSKRNAARDE